MITEIIDNLEDLKPGDIIIYASGGELKTARVEKTPTKKPGLNWYNSTRMSICVETHEYMKTKWSNGVSQSGPATYDVQKFNLENDKFNKIKYLNLYRDKLIMRLIQL